MNKNIINFTLISLMLLSQCCFADIDPNDLIKVDDKTDPKCVEYFSYRDASYCSTKPVTKPVDPKIYTLEKQTIVFDDRPWQAVWGKKTDEMTMIEYVPKGDNINNWHELVTSQFFSDLQKYTTVKEFAKNFIDGIVKYGFKTILTYIKTTPDQIIFEWRIVSPENKIETDINMVTKGPDGIYVLFYSIKESNISEEKRKQWIQNLENSRLKITGEQSTLQ